MVNSPGLKLVAQRSSIIDHDLRLKYIVFFIVDFSKGGCPDWNSVRCPPGTLERFEIFHANPTHPLRPKQSQKRLDTYWDIL